MLGRKIIYPAFNEVEVLSRTVACANLNKKLFKICADSTNFRCACKVSQFAHNWSVGLDHKVIAVCDL